MSSTVAPVLWDILSHNLPQFHWKAMVNPAGVIASCHHLEEEKSKKKVKQYLISNVGTPVSWSKESVNPQQATASISLTHVTTTTETVLRRVDTISTIGISSTTSQPYTTSTIDVGEIIEATIDKATTECHTIFTQTALEMPIYTEEALVKMKNTELTLICNKYNIKVGGKRNKVDYVKAIYSRSKLVIAGSYDLPRLQRLLETAYLDDPAPLHLMYRAFFNFIDKADRRWNSMEDHHGVNDWRIKYAKIILRFATINAWALKNSRHPILWRKWRKDIVVEILKHHVKK